MTEPWWGATATELSRAMRGGEVSAREVMQSHLDRIEEVNGRLNAVVKVLDVEALEAADRADALQRSGAALPPLHGVPLSVKENIDVAGHATTQGVPAMASTIAPVDAPVVERMRAAGAIPFARTNLPDFGLRVHTDSGLHGLTRNPWDQLRTAGGSSGGEGSALASGMSPLGLGNDIGGSLRNPAYACGVASIKPSTHRIPGASATMPGFPSLSSQLMSVEGVMARSIADVRAGFEVVAGPHPRDPFCAPVPYDGPGGSGACKVALVPEPPGGSTAPEVAEGVRAAGRALEAAGYEVEEVTPPMVEDAIVTWAQWLLSDLLVMKPILELVLSPDALTFLQISEEAMGAAPTVTDLVLAMQKRFEIARAWHSFFERYPVVVGPTWCQAPFTHGYDIESPTSAMATLEMLRFVTPMNLLGIPAACVPVGLAGGLPLGVQVVADRFREDRCLATAAVLEEHFGRLTPIDPR